MERDELELISVNLKEAVGRGDFVKVGHQIKRLDKLLKKSLPSEEDTLKYFYHIGGRDKLMNINLKNKVTFGDRLEEFKQNSASQTEMPSEEENFKWYKLGANDEANELYDPTNPEVSFNTRRQLTK